MCLCIGLNAPNKSPTVTLSVSLCRSLSLSLVCLSAGKSSSGSSEVPPLRAATGYKTVVEGR